MSGVAGWLAPAATMVAAVMTAANLGARVTGWGFAVFVIGSLAWCVVGISTGQTNLLATNGFLTLVNLVGVWRWLGREARYNRDADAIAEDSKEKAAPTLIPAAKLAGKKVRDKDGNEVAEIVDAMIGTDGQVHALLIRQGGVGGVGEAVSILDHKHVTLDENCVETDLHADAISRLPAADSQS